MTGFSVLLALSCLSCSESALTAPGTPVLPPEPPAPVAHLAGRVVCSGTVATAELTCRLEEPRVPAGVSPAVLGQGKVKMASTNVQYDTLTEVFSFDATVQNLLTEPLGTPDGTTKSGIKVAYHIGPNPTSYYTPGDTGSIRVANADGTVNFTRKDQPYHFYDTILAPGAISSPLNWKMEVPRNVATFEFAVLVFAAIPGEPRVPEVPPDSVPDWIHAASNTVSLGPGFSYPRNIAFINFARNATREEKQAAIDLIGGEVIGGYPAPETYAVRIQDDGTTWPLLEALKVLKALPQVDAAFEGAELVVTHLRPDEKSSGWRREDWALVPDSAAGEKWGLERIAAPLAWGCETGNPSLSIGVIDNGFHAVGDLKDNVASSSAFGLWPGKMHGTQVASVLAASGDNQEGMTGLMWRAKLDLYDPFTINAGGETVLYLHKLQTAFLTAALSSDIINLSVGIYWEKQFGRPPAKVYVDSINNPQEDSARIGRFHDALRKAIEWVNDHYQKQPLVIISASNDGIDAYWSGLANVAADPGIGDRVIVVGASNIQDNLSSFSNRNVSQNLVSVLAPGEAVGTLDETGTIVLDSGASFATPYVTGLAGLLKSFDPRLTAAELKEYIIAGADSSGRKADGIPIINAYESLKRVAKRPGAPLCGNRIWLDNGKLRARRGQIVEELFQAPSLARDVMPFHGGRRVRLYDYSQASNREWRLTGTSWSELADPPYPDVAEMAGAYTSLWSYSHDADLFVKAYGSGTPLEHVTSIVIENMLTGQTTQVATHTTPLWNNTTSVCGRQVAQFVTDSTGTRHFDGYSCASQLEYTTSASRVTVAHAVFSPIGDKVFLAISRDGYSGHTTPFEPCVGTDTVMGVPNHLCRRVVVNGASAGSEVYSISLADTSDVRMVWSSNSGEIIRLGISEDGREAVAHIGDYVFSDTTYFVNGQLWGGDMSSAMGSGGMVGCRTEFRSVSSGNLLDTVPIDGDCIFIFQGTSTISPSLLGSMNDGLSPGAIRSSNR